MATVLTKYKHTQREFLSGTFSWQDNYFSIALINNFYVFDENHTHWANVYDFEIPEGNGYTRNGELIQSTSSTNGKLLCSDVTFKNLTAVFYQGVIMERAEQLGETNMKLIAHILFDDTPAAISVNGIDFVIGFPNGIFNLI